MTTKVPSDFLDKIVLGDCIDLLRDLPDGSVDLVVSSPPYNLGKEYEAKRALEVYLEEQAEVLAECARVMSPKGSIFWQVGSFADRGLLVPLDIRVFPMLESFGLIPRNRIAWIRSHGVHGRKKFSCRYETILWFTKSDDYPFHLDEIRVPQKYQNKKAWKGEKKGHLTCNPNGKNPADLWAFRNVKHNHEEQTIHPCQFPEDLIARIMLAVTDPGDVVLDPYIGAGTVAVVARDEGRHFVGAELKPEYHEVAQQRLSGEPNEAGCFPNLKTLRDYVERTGEDISRFRFAMQVGKRPTGRSKSRIYPEEHHLGEMLERFDFEEAAFGAARRGQERPVDKKLNGNGRPTTVSDPELSLFDQSTEKSAE